VTRGAPDGPVQVRRATLGDLDAAAAVLADAFADSTWTRWTVDGADHADRIAGLQRLVIEHVALPHGEVWIAADDIGAIVSAAIWMLPASSVPDTTVAAMAITQAQLEGDRHEAAARAEAIVAPLRPAEPHYYLGAVGTRGDRQRQGIASAVLQPVLDRAGPEGAIAFLETSAPGNVAFYERLGFAVTGELDVPGGGPHVWAMTRR
jgi:GNAT superfamily N-acetyltransferase